MDSGWLFWTGVVGVVFSLTYSLPGLDGKALLRKSAAYLILSYPIVSMWGTWMGQSGKRGLRL